MIYGCDPDLNAFFFTFCLNMEIASLLMLKVAFKIPQNSYRGLASLISYRQKTKGNANKAWVCIFTHSESQKWPKMAKKGQKWPKMA